MRQANGSAQAGGWLTVQAVWLHLLPLCELIHCSDLQVQTNTAAAETMLTQTCLHWQCSLAAAAPAGFAEHLTWPFWCCPVEETAPQQHGSTALQVLRTLQDYDTSLHTKADVKKLVHTHEWH